MMPTTPDFVYLMCTVECDSFPAAVTLFMDAFGHAGLPAVEAWSIPARKAKRAGTLAQAQTAIAAAAADGIISNGIFYLKEDVAASIYDDTDDRPGCYGLRLSKAISEATSYDMLAFIAGAADVCRYLLRRGVLVQAALLREGGGLSCTPDVPLVHTTSHVAVVTEQQVRDAYDDPDVFWNAGWDVSESFGERRLLVRGLDIPEGPDYLASILPHQWAMARAAKAGLTRYYAPQVEPEEREVYRTGSPTLDIVGHLATEHVLELSCALEPGQHCEIAHQERRPLLDIGASVFCYDDAGELLELKD